MLFRSDEGEVPKDLGALGEGGDTRERKGELDDVVGDELGGELADGGAHGEEGRRR